MNIRLILIFLVWATVHTLVRAQTAPMYAATANGHLTIVVKDLSIFNTYFVVEPNDSVGLAFYFSDVDSRNGKHRSKTTTLGNGQISMEFTTLAVPNNDPMVFHAYEELAGGIVKGYVFIGNQYVGTTAPTIAECPTAISCSGGGISITFPSTTLLGVPAPTITIFAPGLSINGPVVPSALNIATNSYLIRRNSIEQCSLINNGPVVVIINGMTCVLNGTDPGPFAGYAGDSPTCSQIFEECPGELMSALNFLGPTLMCKEWIPYYSNLCGTSTTIKSGGRIVIGSDKSPIGEPLSLNVKNGIITDKLKLCKTQWCDYVFAPDYPLLSLAQVEQHIKEKRHLPGMPSEAQIEGDGSFELGDITYRQQEKIEELFLYLIQQEQEISDLEALAALLQLREHLGTY